jgi:CRISPR/Cas system-associated endonuclease Cas1
MNKNILYLDEPNLLICVQYRTLVLKMKNKFYSLPKNVQTIVASGWGFAITGAAIKACIGQKIELLISDNDATFVSLFAPEPCAASNRTALAIRLKQFEALIDPVKMAGVARAIVAAKIRAEKHPRQTERSFLSMLKIARSPDDIRHVEAKSAQTWWSRWSMFEMRFAGPGVPGEWCSWPGRYNARRQGKLGELPRNSRRVMLSIRCKRRSTTRPGL